MPSVRKLKPLVLPKRPTTVEEWIEAKKKAPAYFITNQEGDAIVPANKEKGETENVLMINPLVPAKKAFIEDFYAKRAEELKVAEEEFAKLKRELHQTVLSYKREEIGADVVAIKNNNVYAAQAKVNMIAKYPRILEEVTGIEQYDLTFDWYRRGKFSMPVSAYMPSAFPWQAFWMPGSMTDPVVEDQSEENQDNQDNQEGGKQKKNYTPKQRAIIASIMKKRYSKA
jgi:hypothetical protein